MYIDIDSGIVCSWEQRGVGAVRLESTEAVVQCLSVDVHLKRAGSG